MAFVHYLFYMFLLTMYQQVRMAYSQSWANDRFWGIAYDYFADEGVRNAILDSGQQEENHIMDNIIHNELKIRGFQVDVGA